jgi:hypothetical protein
VANITGPTRLDFASRTAWVWRVEHKPGITHRVVWLPGSGGRLLLSTLRDDGLTWTPAVELSGLYSPRSSLAAARSAVEAWANRQDERDRGYRGAHRRWRAS